VHAYALSGMSAHAPEVMPLLERERCSATRQARSNIYRPSCIRVSAAPGTDQLGLRGG
jgi:hypothetical protein